MSDSQQEEGILLVTTLSWPVSRAGELKALLLASGAPHERADEFTAEFIQMRTNPGPLTVDEWRSLNRSRTTSATLLHAIHPHLDIRLPPFSMTDLKSCTISHCRRAIDPATDFDGDRSLAEFKLSGMCQQCQDGVFDAGAESVYADTLAQQEQH